MTYDEIQWVKSPHLSTRKEFYQEQWAVNTDVEVTITHTTRRHLDGSAGATKTRYYIEDTKYKTKEEFCKALENVKRNTQNKK